MKAWRRGPAPQADLSELLPLQMLTRGVAGSYDIPDALVPCRPRETIDYSTAWYSGIVAWHGMAWHGMAWHGMAWHGTHTTYRMIQRLARTRKQTCVTRLRQPPQAVFVDNGVAVAVVAPMGPAGGGHSAHQAPEYTCHTARGSASLFAGCRATLHRKELGSQTRSEPATALDGAKGRSPAALAQRPPAASAGDRPGAGPGLWDGGDLRGRRGARDLR